MSLTTLPNGLMLETPTETEAKIIYHERFARNAYLRNGVTLHDDQRGGFVRSGRPVLPD